MPSYRVTITIGTLGPAVEPHSVLPSAARAASELTTVEASDLGIVSGMPRITVRFTGDDPAFARRVASHVLSTVSSLAEPLAVTLTERVKAHWIAVR